MIQLRKLSLAFLTLTLSVHSFAQTEVNSDVSNPVIESDVISGEKKQTLNFEDELIEGVTQKPDLFYIFQKDNFKFKKLIKLRENFLPEMNKNAEDIQRLRGGR
jgi:hypothetical protein